MDIIERVSPLYTVYYYSDFLYRVVKFKRSRGGVRLLDDDKKSEITDRFEQSYIRSRSMVMQLALCNRWDYFVTITVDPERFDRTDLDRIYTYLSQWIRDFRKKHKCSFSYLLVPELHADRRTWHFHGFLAGIPDHCITKFVRGIHPQKLVDAGYYNFPALAAAVGYVSLSSVRDPVGSGMYIVKYITKEHAHDDFYQHLYFCSRGLSRAKAVADCFCYNSQLEAALSHESDFCAVGWVQPSNFAYPLDFTGCEAREEFQLDPVELSDLAFVDTVEVYDQMKIKLPGPWPEQSV